ncbi:MAG: VOC family protein [Deinococcales bacterium]
MPVNARYVHTNLTARDWQKLAHFYCEVFGCIPKPPERHLSGAWLDKLTGLEAVKVEGIHLQLPGFAANGPTLEIFSYGHMLNGNLPAANEPGFGHLAFWVEDVEAALDSVLKAGGGLVGELSETHISGVGHLKVVYARDPEGNIIELQHWS